MFTPLAYNAPTIAPAEHPETKAGLKFNSEIPLINPAYQNTLKFAALNH
jgi:hypothetical protein